MRVLVLVVFALLSVSGVRAQAEQPPYIHYFDHLRGGLVIERADGTDSRMIPDVPMTAGPPVWSPSGKWMVMKNEIISTDGNRQIPYPLPTLINQLPLTLWSPTDDIILAFGFEATSESIVAQLFDVETQTILANFDIQNPAFRDEEIDLYWEPDGTRAFVSWPGSVVTLYLSGQVAIWADSAGLRAGIDANFHRGRLFSVARWTTKGITLRIETLNGEKQIEFEDQTGRSRNAYTVRWSPSLEHALIYARACSDNNCEGWLKLVDWESGEVTTVMPTIGILPLDWECTWYACTELWSPDGRYAVLSKLLDDLDDIYLLDTSTGAIKQIVTRRDISSYKWSPDGTLYITFNGCCELLAYNPGMATEREIVQPVDTYLYLFPSPDGDYLGLSSAPITIIDKNGETVTQTTQHSHSTHSICCPSDYRWDSSSEWAIAGYPIMFAGSSEEPHAGVVFNMAGTTRRELPTYGKSDFLPEHVVPHLPPGQSKSTKKEPIFILPHDGRVYYIGWHPSDSDRLVMLSDGLIFWSLKDGEPKITDRIVPRTLPQNTHPGGLPLFWLPERELVMFYDFRTWQGVSTRSGEIVPIEEIRLPVYPEEYLDDARFGLPRIPTSDLAAYIVSGVRSNDDPYYIDVSTKRVLTLDIEGTDEYVNLYTADARKGIAVIGALYDCCVTVFSTDDGRQLGRFYGTAVSLAISADGRRLATTSAGMTAIWDISEYLPTD
jgi:WD40 repeat protein